MSSSERVAVVFSLALLLVFYAATYVIDDERNAAGVLPRAQVIKPTSVLAWTTYDFVAHALGAPEGSPLTYCNCREGFESSYQRGFRVFEADVMILADDVPVAYHGGFPERLHAIDDLAIRGLTSDAFDALSYRSYDTLTSWDLLELLDRHPDAYLLLHTKLDHYLELPAWFLEHASSSSVRGRLVPYVWEEAQVDALRALGARQFIIPVHDNLGMTVAKAAALARSRGLDAVLGSASKFDDASLNVLERAGVAYVYADRGYRRFAARDDEERRILEARRMRGLKVYSDGWIASR